MAKNEVAIVQFSGGRTLYGVWIPWLRSLSEALFCEEESAAAHLDCGISRLVDMGAVTATAEDVEVFVASSGDVPVLRTTASWEHGFVTGPCGKS